MWVVRVDMVRVAFLTVLERVQCIERADTAMFRCHCMTCFSCAVHSLPLKCPRFRPVSGR